VGFESLKVPDYFTSLPLPYRLRGPPSRNRWHPEPSSKGNSGRRVQLTTYCLTHVSIFTSAVPVCLYGVRLGYKESAGFLEGRNVFYFFVRGQSFEVVVCDQCTNYVCLKHLFSAVPRLCSGYSVRFDFIVSIVPYLGLHNISDCPVS
jgi:hypothetical protein